MSDQIVTMLNGAVLEIRIDRIAKKNALTSDMYAAMAQALRQADQDASVRVITVTGSGDCFTSGNDLADFLKPDASISDEQPVGRFLATIASMHKPLIAAVNG